MTLALILFVLFYILMLAVQQYRPWVALGGAGTFLLLGKLGVYDFTLADAARAVDFNVLLMMAGMMGTVFLFIQSKMPARLAEELIAHVPDVRWAVSVLALLAGFISAFVDNVATVLMVAPVGLAIARRLKRSPVPVLIAIAVSSNLQGAATLVGDTTSILLGGFAGMNFFDFFWMEGRPGIFWSVELGALASLGVLFWLFRDQRQPVHVEVETKVEDDVPTALLLLTVGLLIAASFLPEPSGGVLHLLYTLRSGLVCMGLCLFGVARACWRSRSLTPLGETARALDYDTLLLLFSLFILLEGVSKAGVIDAAARLFHSAAGDEPLRLYLLLVAASVGLSAFIDNIPYVAAMLPVVQGVAALMNGGAGIEPELFYFGLLTGATLYGGRIKGIRRGALAPVMPCANGQVMLCDAGANTECTAEMLLQFAFLASLYAEKINGVVKPRVGLVNNGTEDTKGDPLRKEAYALLKKAGDEGRLNFVGNVEGSMVPLGACDVAVCDGFTGNVQLKTIEGVAKFMSKEIKGVFMASVGTKLGYLLCKKGMDDFREVFNQDKIGGAPFLGIAKPVIKAHGSSNEIAVMNAVRQAIAYTKSGMIDAVKENIQYMTVSE